MWPYPSPPKPAKAQQRLPLRPPPPPESKDVPFLLFHWSGVLKRLKESRPSIPPSDNEATIYPNGVSGNYVMSKCCTLTSPS